METAHYDYYRLEEYMNKEYGFTDKDWSELIDEYVDNIGGNNCLLTLLGEGDNTLENKIVEIFGNGGDVEVNYWW